VRPAVTATKNVIVKPYEVLWNGSLPCNVVVASPTCSAEKTTDGMANTASIHLKWRSKKTWYHVDRLWYPPIRLRKEYEGGRILDAHPTLTHTHTHTHTRARMARTKRPVFHVTGLPASQPDDELTALLKAAIDGSLIMKVGSARLIYDCAVKTVFYENRDEYSKRRQRTVCT
jgi:hypothetical protein